MLFRSQGIFQSLQSGGESLIVSVCRQLLFVLPVAWIFTHIAISNPDLTSLVWFTFVIAEGISAIISCVFMRRIYRNKIAGITE